MLVQWSSVHVYIKRRQESLDLSFFLFYLKYRLPVSVIIHLEIHKHIYIFRKEVTLNIT